MIVITHLAKGNSCDVIVKSPYMNDDGQSYHNMLTLEFKYNKLRRFFTKCYIEKEYAMDRVDSDIESIKKVFGGHYKIERFKLMSEEKNYG